MARRKSNKPEMISEAAWLIAAYIRLSREDNEGEDESLSITNQRRIIEEFVDDYFEDGSVIVDYYVDDGESGTTDYGRPQFQRLMNDIEKGRINCVIVKTPSRAFRNYADQGYFLESFFPRHQTRFISISNPRADSFMNPESITGLEMPIMGLMNDRFAAQTSEQIRRTFNSKRKRGEFIGAFAPYGYAKDPQDKNKLVIDEEAAEIVRTIFHWFVYDGMSKMGIAKKLNEQGVLNPAAYKRKKGLKFNTPHAVQNDGLWGAKTIHTMLENKMYIGHMVQGKQKIVSYKVHEQVQVPEDQWFVKEDTHEPVISKELFSKAQDIAKRDTRVPSGSKNVYLLSGFVQCADCQRALRRHKTKQYVYYICRTHVDKSKSACTKHSIREEKLIELVYAAVKAQILLVERLSDMVDRINESPIINTKAGRIDSLLESNAAELTRMQKAISSLYLDWKNGDITRDQYRNMKAEFEEKAQRLEQALDNLKDEKRVMEEGISSTNPVFAGFLQNKSIDQLDRGILSTMVDIILVHEDKTITIRFKNEDIFRMILEYINENMDALANDKAD